MIEYDKSKFFYAMNSKEPIYAHKGEDHEDIALRELEKLKLTKIYETKFQDRMDSRNFLVRCGYVLVDISSHTLVIYSEKRIKLDYLGWLKSTHIKSNEDSIYKIEDLPLEPELLNEFYEDDTIKEVLGSTALEL